MDYDAVLSHYKSEVVARNILDYSKDRWVAVHCTKRSKDGSMTMLRYFDDGRPLRFSGAEDIASILDNFRAYMPRTFYATSCRYTVLETKEDAWSLSNVYSCMPVWDIDSRQDEDIEGVIKVASSIISTLDRFGVKRSFFVKWSGRGMHIHLHDLAISEGLRRRYHPLDIAYSITEYIILRSGIASESIKMENKIDPKRVFTCPLSIHRELNRVCICIDPNDLDRFDISWTELGRFRHHDGWNRYEGGEADELALKAYESVGPYPSAARRRRRAHPPLDEQIIRTLSRLDGWA